VPDAFPTRSDDRSVVAAQLGRDVRGDIDVVARCRFGLPSVIKTAPTLEDGTPFPTLYYLVCPVAVRAIGRLEAAGKMREYEERLQNDEALRSAYERAHERYRAQRDAIVVLDDPASAGGMPARVKCLHALYAHGLADANPIGALVRDEIEPLDCSSPCVRSDPGGSTMRVSDHPGFQGKKRRR
jgi:hypothetical protein